MRGDLARARPALDALGAFAERFQVPFGAQLQQALEGLLAIETRGVQGLREHADLALLRGGLAMAPIGLKPTLARVFLALGEPAVAKTVLDELSSGDFANVPRDIGYLGALASLSMLAIQLDDRMRAERLYALLAPYSQHTALSLLSLHEGAVSHFLGLVAAYLGLEGAVVERHFEDALAMNARVAQGPQLARTCYEYAGWLSARNERERSRPLYERARTLAVTMGMAALVDRLPSG